MNRLFPMLAVGLSSLCLLGYFSMEPIGINAQAIVVLFWLALLCAFISFLLIRPKNLAPLAAGVCALALLSPSSEAVLAWSAWWLKGFGP